MELSISSSLQSYGNLLEITVLVQEEKLKTSKQKCEQVVTINDTVFP